MLLHQQRPKNKASPSAGGTHYSELIERWPSQPAVNFLEVHSKNFFGAVGVALAVLQAGRAHYPICLDGVGQKLRQRTPELALLWRDGLGPMVAACPAADAMFIQHLLDRASLAAALDATGDFDFIHWLPQAAQTGLQIGARLLTT